MFRLEARFETRQMKNKAEKKIINEMTFDEFSKALDQLSPRH